MGGRRQSCFHVRDKGVALDGKSDHRAVGGDVPLILRPGNELVAIVGEAVAAGDAQIAGFQFHH